MIRCQPCKPPMGASSGSMSPQSNRGLRSGDHRYCASPASAHAAAETRAPGESLVKLESASGDRRHLRIAIINDDKPFLVDSVAATIAAQGLGIDRLLHPVIPIVVRTVKKPWRFGDYGIPDGYADTLALVGMTLVIAYLSLVFGELVPKRLAMQRAVGFTRVLAPPLNLFAVGTIVLLTVATIVFFERGQRRIPIYYARRTVGRRVYGGQTAHLPLKVNTSGTIPPIFASSLLMFPATLANLKIPGMAALQASLERGDWLFNVFYVALRYDPARSMRSGGFEAN